MAYLGGPLSNHEDNKLEVESRLFKDDYCAGAIKRKNIFRKRKILIYGILLWSSAWISMKHGSWIRRGKKRYFEGNGWNVGKVKVCREYKIIHCIRT